MHRLLIAAALGLGLLAAGGTQAPADATAFGATAQPARIQADALLMPVQYQRHGYGGRHHYAPPPRHFQRHHHAAPPRHHRSYHGYRHAPAPHHVWRQPRPQQYGWRY